MDQPDDAGEVHQGRVRGARSGGQILQRIDVVAHNMAVGKRGGGSSPYEMDPDQSSPHNAGNVTIAIAAITQVVLARSVFLSAMSMQSNVSTKTKLPCRSSPNPSAICTFVGITVAIILSFAGASSFPSVRSNTRAIR